MRKHYLLATCIGVLFLNHLLTAIQPGEHYPSIIRDIIFNGARFGTLVFAGWVIVRLYGRSLVAAALFTAVIFAVDHLLLKPIYLLIISTGRDVFELGWLPKTYVVLLQSFLLFSPVAMLLGVIGGAIAQKGTMRHGRTKKAE